MNLKHMVHSSVEFLPVFIAFLIFLSQGIQYQLPTTETLFLVIFSPAGPINQINTLLVTEWIAVSLFFFFTVADSFAKDLKISYVYIFPRAGTKRKWLRNQTKYLLWQVLLFWAVLFILVFLAAGMVHLPDTHLTAFYLELYVGVVTTSFFIAFLENVLSLQFGTTPAFITAAAFFAGVLYIGMFSYEYMPSGGLLFILLPPLGALLQWHSDAVISTAIRLGAFPYAPIPGFSLWKSWIITIGFFCVLYWILYCKIEKRDSVDLIKGEL